MEAWTFTAGALAASSTLALAWLLQSAFPTTVVGGLLASGIAAGLVLLAYDRVDPPRRE